VVVAWVTGSGVRVGEILLRLEARLDECNIPRDAPLFCPTSPFSRGGFKVPAPGTEARFQNRLRLLLKQRAAGDLRRAWLCISQLTSTPN